MLTHTPNGQLRDVVLTIGLPLAAGLTIQEFAGVLAHEFGHFAQGAGMKLTYLIRATSAWFAREGLLPEAIDHALAGDAAEDAATCIEALTPTLFATMSIHQPLD